jgi:hypothetical protein
MYCLSYNPLLLLLLLLFSLQRFRFQRYKPRIIPAALGVFDILQTAQRIVHFNSRVNRDHRTCWPAVEVAVIH